MIAGGNMPNESLDPPEGLRQRRLQALEAPGLRRDRLDSWKEIARYLGRQVRTVQVWEKLEGLPVHRHFHRSRSSVFAFRSELDAWHQGASGEPVRALGSDHLEATSLENGAGWRHGRVTVAVLPFDCIDGSPEQQRFGDGLVSEIIVKLGRLCPERLGVISRTAVMEYKKSMRSVDQLGQELNTSYLIEGTNHVENGTIRINVSLVRLKDKTNVWSQSYTGNLKGSFHLQSLVANQIAHCLCLTLLASGESGPALLPIARPAAWDAYVLGRFLWKKRTEESVQRAMRYFEFAIREDPRFALAHAGLADCFTVLAFFGIVSPSRAQPAAQQAAVRAVESDPASAEAHASLALVLFHFDHDWIRAEREFQTAIQCDPTYAFSYHGYAKLLGAKGQHEAAHLAIMRAVTLDPAPITIVWAGAAAHAARRYDEAMNHYQRALQFDPHSAWAHLYMAETLEQTGHISEALIEYDTAIHLCGGSPLAAAMKAHAHAVSGDRRAALRILNHLSEIPNQPCVPSYDIAAVYAAIGEYKQTFAWLYRAFAERNIKLFTFGQDPRFDAVRDRAECRRLVDREFKNIYS
jgi:TolB-like protein/Flp pilus assembly protein TadD